MGNYFNCNQLHNNFSESQRFRTVPSNRVFLRGSGTSRCCATCSQFHLASVSFQGV